MMKRVKSKIAVFVLLCFLFFQPAYSRAQSYSVTSAALDYFDNAKSALSGYLSGFPDVAENLSATVKSATGGVFDAVDNASWQAAASITGFFGAAKDAVFSVPKAIKEFIFSPSDEPVAPDTPASPLPSPSQGEGGERSEPSEVITPPSERNELGRLRQEIENLKTSDLREKPRFQYIPVPPPIPTLPPVSEITKLDLEVRLNQINNKFLSDYAELKNIIAEKTQANFNAIALSQRINNLSNVAISSPTISSPTISGSGSIAGASLSISGAGGITGNATLGADLNVDSGTLYVDSANNRVGVGTTSPQYALDVDGTLRATSLIAASQTINGNLGATGNLTVDGNSTFGNATSTDIVYLNSRLADHLIPTADNLLDLGDATNWLRWRTGYFGASVGIGGTATSTGSQLTASGAYLIDSAGTLSINTTNNQNVILGSGNVGIGTTSPYAKLSVEGSSALGNSALAGYFTATTSTASVFPYASTTALTVSGNSYLGTVSSGLWNGALLGVPYGGTGWAAIQSGTIPYGNGSSALSTTTAGTAGNVLALLNGIPTWTATSTLSEITGTLSVAKGGTGQTSFGQGWLNSDGATLSASTSPTVAWLTATSTTATSTFAGGLAVETSGLVYDYSTNNVGIGTAGPVSLLDLRKDTSGGPVLSLSGAIGGSANAGSVDFLNPSATVAVRGRIQFQDSSDDSGLFKFYTRIPGSGPSGSLEERLRITSSGLVGIGTTTPWRTLSIEGTAAFKGLVNDGTGYYACLNTTSFQLATSTTACGASSIRFKENIEPLSYGLAEVSRLNPIFFKWKNDFIANSSKQIGLIAEEVEPIIPEIIGYDSEGNIMNLDYPKLTAVLIKAIQELNLKIEDLAGKTPSPTPSVQTSSTLGVGESFAWILEQFKNIGVIISNGAVTAREFIADKITTKELCVEDVCVNRNQLKELMEKNSITPSTPGVEETSDSPPDGQNNENAVAPTAPQETASSTPDVAESPKPDPVAEPAPEPEPEPNPEPTTPEPATLDVVEPPLSS